MPNPLLETHLLPPFSRIEAAHVEPAIRQLIERNQQAVEQLLAATDHYSWDNLLRPIEALEDELQQAWSPVSHLNGVLNSEDLRAAYNACLPLLSRHSTWMGQHQQLYGAYRQIAQSAQFDTLDTAQRKAVENALRDFRLAGVALPQEQKERYATLRARLSELGSKFSENVLDATNAWSKLLTREQLQGLPQSALDNARQAAQRAGREGYLINLEYPCVAPLLNYCDDADLRREVYTANVTRASETGPHGGQWDNTDIIMETLDLRQQLAQLLGFDDYTELSLATKMAVGPEQVMAFLQQLAQQSRDQARAEWQGLTAFARDQYGVQALAAWDVAYYSEKLRQQRYQLSQEDLRPYLPVTRVLPGLFEVIRRLYGLTVREVAEFDRYHPDVRLFELLQDDSVIARFYLDLYARADKRGGAWMADCRVRRQTDRDLQLPVAYLVCNFTPPVDGVPALLTHDELTTLFHEFGHGLHHMLTRQCVAAVSGINGVAWDAVELPSQFLENWCWEPEALAFISGHYATGEPLPGALLERLLAARNFHSAMALARQLEFALFDFRLHREWHTGAFASVQSLLDAVRAQVAVLQPPPCNRFQNSFSHIFAGGYAAGYYAYKWAEVLSADAFSRFEQEGIFNSDTGAQFRRHILETGGARDAMELFVAFRGREPAIDALLRHSGIAGKGA
ncbi:MAG: oligopeptidase A [Halioglobus sp.]|nr:oligopeptidase A [Halioglobus sp.]